MRKVTFWFGRHVLLARIIIAFVHIFFTALAMQFAGWLQRLPFYFPTILFAALISSCLLLSAATHVTKKRHKLSVSTVAGYALVRIKYAMVLIATYLFVVGWYYQEVHINLHAIQHLHGSMVTSHSSSGIVAKEVRDAKPRGSLKKQNVKISLRELRVALKEARLLQQQSGNNSTAHTWAIIGIVVLAVILAWFVLALSCSLSCSGSGTGAIIVGVLGIAGIIFGTVMWIKHVNRKARQQLESQ